MGSAVNARCKPFTSDSCPLPTLSWGSLVVITSPRVPRSLAGLPALDQATVELLRTLFQEDLVKRMSASTSPGGLSDRLGNHWLVVDVDATRQAARQRALPVSQVLIRLDGLYGNA